MRVRRECRPAERTRRKSVVERHVLAALRRQVNVLLFWRSSRRKSGFKSLVDKNSVEAADPAIVGSLLGSIHAGQSKGFGE